MKQFSALLAAVLLLLTLCACTFREPAPATPDSVQKAGTQSQTKPAKNGNKTESTAPASGSDLLIPEPMSDEAADALARLQTVMAEDGSLCALAFLGYVPENVSIPEAIAASGLAEQGGCWEDYPFLKEITPMQCAAEGHRELYCLVPADASARLMLSESETDVPVFESENGLPLLFTADSGADGSDLLLTVTPASGAELRFSPCLEALSSTEGVTDFSVYPDLDE